MWRSFAVRTAFLILDIEDNRYCIHCTVWGCDVAQARSLHSSTPSSTLRGGMYDQHILHQHWTDESKGEIIFKLLVAHLILLHFYCAITCLCRGTSLTCIFLNLHMKVFYVLGHYLCTLSCTAMTLSYLKQTASKGRLHIVVLTPLAYWFHMFHIFSGPKGRWGGS